MGMFDTIHLKCPVCEEVVEEQTKDGDCVLGYYNLDNMPKHMLINMDGYEMTCSKGHTFHVQVQSIIVANIVEGPCQK